ncbi:MAG: putative Subtilisin [Promethearchaeota archaeon]|nr:MAG: putative Subtilisin [Candidatus Lokiarchaeota archaeon]
MRIKGKVVKSFILMLFLFSNSFLIAPSIMGITSTSHLKVHRGSRTPFIDPKLQELLSNKSISEKQVSLILDIKKDHIADTVKRIKETTKLKIDKTYKQSFMMKVSGEISEIKKLSHIETIKGIYLDNPIEISSNSLQKVLEVSNTENKYPNISQIIESQDVSKNLGVNKSDEGDDIVIAILDSGIDIPGQLNGDLDDFDDNESTFDPKLFGAVSMVPYEPIYYNDFSGSGTFHAGVAAGTGGRNATFRGIAPKSYVLNVKVLDSFGLTYSSFVISGLEWAMTHDADVLTLPWTFPGFYDDPISLAINKIVDRGVVVIVPAGDDGPSYTSVLTPGQSLKAITVGAYNHISNDVANFSSRGPTYDLRSGVDVIAPGVNIVGPRVQNRTDLESLNLTQFTSFDFPVPSFEVDVPDFGKPINENYTIVSSTTAATAVVSGACAVLLSLFPLATPELVKLSLMKTASPINSKDNAIGSGLINTNAAALWLKDYLSMNYTIGTRIPQGSIYPGMVINADYQNLTDTPDQPENMSTYNSFALTSTQSMMSALFITNGSLFENYNNSDLHLPLNQFALSFNSSHYLFSDLLVLRELANSTSYSGYDESGYARWTGVLGLEEELFITVLIETWSYAYEETLSVDNITERITAFKFSFKFINIGSKHYTNLTLHSFFKADLYLNEYNITDPYNIDKIENASTDDEVKFDPTNQMIYAIDKYELGPNATNEYTCIGFNSTTHNLIGWEINDSNILFEELYNGDFSYSNDNETKDSMPNKDLGFIQSWKITENLVPDSKANFSGVFSIGKDNSSKKATSRMKRSMQLIKTNVSQPIFIDMAIITTETDRMYSVNEKISLKTYIINFGNVKINNTELWFIANLSAKEDRVNLYTSLIQIKNWEPFEILVYDIHWNPTQEGPILFSFILGGFLNTSIQDDSLFNNYQDRTIFIYNLSKISAFLEQMVIIKPNAFPLDPFSIQYPGDIGVLNITLISPIELDSIEINVNHTYSQIIDLGELIYDDSRRYVKVPVTVIVPFFYKIGLYYFNLDILINKGQSNEVFLRFPIQFQLEDYKGRIMFDGLHNEILQAFTVENISQEGLKIKTYIKERLDYIYGNFFSFKEMFTSIQPKGMAINQLIPNLNVTAILQSQIEISNIEEKFTGDGVNQSLALEQVFKGENFFNFSDNIPSDRYSYDLVKFFDCLIISDPEIPFNDNEISSLTRYLRLGGNIVIFAENSTENDLNSINRLLSLGNLRIGTQYHGKRIVGDCVINNKTYTTELVDPMKIIPKSANEDNNITFVSDYMAISTYEKGKIAVIGDEQLISENQIKKQENKQFVFNFMNAVLNNSLNIDVETSSNNITKSEKVYINLNLNDPEDLSLLESDFLAIMGFVDESGTEINGSLFGFDLPFMPLIQTNESALYSYFDSSWVKENKTTINIVLYIDTPSTLSETYSFEILINPPPTDGEDPYSPKTPPYSSYIDILFLSLFIAQLGILWAYSAEKWKSRHKYVEMKKEKENLLKNYLSAFFSEIKRLELGIRSKKLGFREKLRFILTHEEKLKEKLKNIKKLAADIGEL